MLVGRSSERARIDRLLAEARRGRSGTLVLRGEAGVGKSALLRHAVHRASRLRTLICSGVEGESEFAFAGLHQLVGPVLDRLDEIPQMQASALQGALALAEAQGVGRLYVGAATLSLLAAAGPALCVIDDAQWLDGPSADALTFAARRLAAEGVVMLFATHQDADRFSARGLPEMRIRGLGSEDAATLLGLERPGAVSADVATRLSEATRGNPLALRQLASLLSDDQLRGRAPLPHPLPIGEDLAQAFLTQAKGLSRPAREALLVAAASDTGAMHVLIDVDRSITAALEECERAGLLSIEGGRYEFSHPLLRAAVYRSAPPDERRRAHHAIAEALAGNDRYRERRAWHVAAAAIAPDAAIAADLGDAGRSAAARRAHVPAAALFERAARFSVADGDRARYLAEAAREAWFAGQAERATQLLRDALVLATEPSLVADVRTLEARVAASTGDRSIDLAELERAADAVEATDPERASVLLTAAARASDVEKRALADRAAALAPPASAAETLSHVVLATLMTASGELDEARSHLEAATCALERDPRLREDPELLMDVVDALAEIEIEDESRRALLEVAGAASREHAIVVLPRVLLQLGSFEVDRGAWYPARLHLFEAAQLFEETGQRRLQVVARARGALLDALCGRADEARVGAGSLRDTPGWDPDRTTAAADRILGVLALGTGDLAAAVDRLRGWTRERASDLIPWKVTDPIDLIEALVRTDAAVEAVEVVRTVPEGSVARAWANALLECDGRDVRGLRAASETYVDRNERPFAVARLRLHLGERLRRQGERVLAREQLRAALQAFDDLGAVPWSEKARRELRASGERLRRGDATNLDRLTPQELQVASVIVEGRSNKEAAAMLFLSTKTIEFHLGKIYRKLGVRTRGELAALVARRGLPT